MKGIKNKKSNINLYYNMNVAYSKDALISSEISFDVIRKFRTFHLIERSPETPVIV